MCMAMTITQAPYSQVPRPLFETVRKAGSVEALGPYGASGAISNDTIAGIGLAAFLPPPS